MAMLDLATMQDWLRRQQGTAPPPEPQGAPLPPPSAPAVSDVSAQPSELERLMSTYRQYVTDYSPEKLQAAQAQDRGEIQGNRYAQMMGNATGLMINNPGAVKIPEPMPMAVKDWAMRREVGKESIGQQQAMMAMDPNGQIAAAKGAALGSLGIKFPPGTSPMVMDSYLAALKAGADPMKVAAEIRNLGATTAKTTAEIPGVEAAARKTEAEIPLVGAQVAKTQAEVPLVGAQTAAARAEVPLKNAQTAKTSSEVGVEREKLDIERGNKGTKQVGDLRGEFQGLPVVKNMTAVAEAKSKIDAASQTGAGDIALVYGYMKLLDPNSSVREGEFATAANAGSAFDRVGALYNKVLNGQKLPDAIRQQFKTEAGGVFAAQKSRFDATAEQYRRLATQQGLNPADVVLDTGLEKAGQVLGKPAAPGNAGAGSATIHIGEDGKRELHLADGTVIKEQ